MKRLVFEAVGAMVNAIRKSNMLDVGKGGGSSLTTSFCLYFLKLHSCNYTLPPLIKRRNRGNLFIFYNLYILFPITFG